MNSKDKYRQATLLGGLPVFFYLSEKFVNIVGKVYYRVPDFK
tara:strand:+ start:103 stop:228 length:126 start_codon:yes stop_codon:yes gene_type:complete